MNFPLFVLRHVLGIVYSNNIYFFDNSRNILSLYCASFSVITFTNTTFLLLPYFLFISILETLHSCCSNLLYPNSKLNSVLSIVYTNLYLCFLAVLAIHHHILVSLQTVHGVIPICGLLPESIASILLSDISCSQLCKYVLSSVMCPYTSYDFKDDSNNDVFSSWYFLYS